jgi:hypothetical protein
MPHTSSSHVLLMPNSKHLTYGINNLVSLITKTKLGLSEPRSPERRGHARWSGGVWPVAALARVVGRFCTAREETDGWGPRGEPPFSRKNGL